MVVSHRAQTSKRSVKVAHRRGEGGSVEIDAPACDTTGWSPVRGLPTSSAAHPAATPPSQRTCWHPLGLSASAPRVTTSSPVRPSALPPCVLYTGTADGVWQSLTVSGGTQEPDFAAPTGGETAAPPHPPLNVAAAATSGTQPQQRRRLRSGEEMACRPTPSPPAPLQRRCKGMGRGFRARSCRRHCHPPSSSVPPAGRLNAASPDLRWW